MQAYSEFQGPSKGRPFAAFLFVALGSVALAGPVSVLAYQGVHALHANLSFSLTELLVGYDLSKYFNRAWLVCFCLGLIWLLARYRLVGAGFWSRTFAQGQLVRALYYALCAVALVGIFEAIDLVQGYAVRRENSDILGLAVELSLGTLLVAVIEEFIFRWGLLKIFARTFGILKGAILLSLLFAYLHFKAPGANFQAGQAVGFADGWQLVWLQLTGISESFALLKFSSLFFLSVGLSCLVIRGASILPAIGLHFGLIWPLMIFKKSTEWLGGQEPSFWLGGADLVSGIVPCLCLFVFAVWQVMLLARAKYLYG